MFKKILFIVSSLSLILFSNISIIQADTPARWFWINKENVTEFSTLWTEDAEDDELIDIIKSFINWALWLLSLIALVIILYAWFKMVTANWDEEKYKGGFKIIKQAAIWLVVIWLSWFIVSMVFWIIEWSIDEWSWNWNSWQTQQTTQAYSL